MLPFIDLDVLMTMPNEALKKQIEIIYSALFPEGINNDLTDECKNKALVVLKNAGIEPQTKTEEGFGFLHCVVKSDHVGFLNALISMGFDVNIKDANNFPLFYYVTSVSMMSLALTINKIEIKNEDLGLVSWHLLFLAFIGEAQLIKELLTTNNLDITRIKGGSLVTGILHCAVLGGQIETVKMLLAKGCDKKIKDSKGADALHYVMMHDERKAIIDSCIDNEYKAKFLNYNLADQVLMLKTLIAHNFNLNTTDDDGAGLLHYGIKYGAPIELFEVLITEGLNPNNIQIQDRNKDACKDKAPGLLDYVEQAWNLDCAQSNRRELIEQLVDKGFLDIHTKDKKGNGILYYLLEFETPIEIYKALIAKGLDLYANDARGNIFLAYLNDYYYDHNNTKAKLIADLVCEGLFDANKIAHILIKLNAPVEIFQLLIEKGLDLNAKEMDGHGFLDSLGDRHYHDWVIQKLAALVNAGFLDINIKNKNRDSLLYYLVRSTVSIEVFELFIAEGLNLNGFLNYVDPYYFKSMSKIIVALIEKDLLDLNITNVNGKGLLHYAIEHDQINLVQLLIDKGFGYNDSIIYYLIKYNSSIEIYKAFINNGLDLNAQGASFLDYLLNPNFYHHKVHINVALVNEGLLDINMKDRKGNGLLHYASRLGQIALVETLIAKGLNVHAKDNEGVDVLSQAVYSGNCELIKILITKYGVKPNSARFYRDWLAVGSMNRDAATLCDNDTFNALYENYLTSFVVAAVNNTGLIVPAVTSGILQSYLLPCKDEPKEREMLEAMVYARKELLRPLVDYCDMDPLNNKARAVLNSLLISLQSGVLAVENKLDELLAQPPQDYSPSLIDCRLNTARITGNKLRFAKSYVAIVQDILKPQEQKVLKLQQQANEGPQLSYMLQLKCLQTLAAVSAVALTAGLIAISLSVPIGFGIALLATGAAGGLAACGFYSQRQKVNQPLYREMDRTLSLINLIKT